jgi:N4-gp56 family major capsid protein
VQDVKATLQQYGVLYRFTDRLADFHTDDVPARFKDMVGDETGLMREKIRWGVLRAGTNVYRAGNVASRSLVNGLISGNLLRNVSRGLANQRATMITNILKASVDVGTEPVEGGWVALCHTNLKADIRSQLAPDFIHISEYGTHVGGTLPEEFGSWEDFRFCASVELDPYLLAGAPAAANTRLSNGVPNSAGTELCDVYPIVVLAEDAYGDVMLRGEDSINPTFIPAGTKTKDDPLGQRGFVGCKFYFAMVRLNEGHMAVVEVACSALST